ncbi:ATP-binding cassette sub-family B member 6, mitochondrial-like [Actinia tenebrosa]|uniref:ATP-binding cassette sub-family B member 6, mitochondrial-like n=1 Tax=Actinia tenebrosa TaxID=6105 RepID=A0A6P8IN87_ACTTE|nr:ATP-binding cassette sub-family B member 6, mitochondrial-like [Actinia tenebrosa]XP_031568503.1 ATP-binding cassette sub-family B member 6, mitochondrial-like [Actinia tenebrosa]
MKVCSIYCEFNESLIHGASEDEGLPRCIMETYPPAILLALILFIGLVKYIQRKERYKNAYRNFDSTEDAESGPVPNNEIPHDIRFGTVNRTNSKENGHPQIPNPVKFVHGTDQMSFLFTFQQFLHVCLMIVPLIDFATKGGLDSSRLQGVTIFFDAASLLLWLIGLLVLRYESIAFFKAKRSSHSLGMILFWGLAFINENLSFISWNNKHWWFEHKTTIKQVELGLFITRYVCISLLFLLGLKAPGLYKPEPVLEVHVRERQGPNEATSVVSDRSGQSAFKDFWKKCKMLWPFLWPSNRWLQLKVVVCFILLALGRVVNVLIPYSYKLIVNKLTGVGNHKVVDPYALIGIYVALKWMGTGNSGALSNLRTFVWIRIQQFTSRTLQVRLFEHLHSLSLRWHITRKTGEVITMVNRGSNSIYNLLNYILFNIVPTIADIIIAIVYFIVAFNGWFGLIVFISMSAYLASTIIVTEWRTKFRRDMNIRDNDAKAKAVDSLLNFETVKYYAGEEFEVNRLNDAIVGYQECEWKVLGSLAILNTAQNTIINVGLLVGAMYCGHLVVNGTLGVGEFVQFITYMVQLYVPLNFFGTYYRLIQSSFVDMENMFDLFSQGREVLDPPDATILNVSNGLIEFKDVSFGYNLR